MYKLSYRKLKYKYFTSKIIPRARRIMMQYINPELLRPDSARIIVTRNCPLKCKMCTFWYKEKPDPSLELIKYWIKELVNFGIKDIAIGGGEPFIRRDLVDIVKEIKSYGITCSVTTSGWGVGKVPFPPVDRCVISIDGATPQTHDRIRGVKGSWQQAINAVRIAKEHCTVEQLNFVLQTDNYRELVEFCQLAKQLDVPVSIIPISLKLAAQSSVSEMLKEFDTHLLRQLINKAIEVGNVLNNLEFIQIFLSKLEKGGTPQRCMAPFNCILIFANGDVYPCGNFDVPIGNLSEGKSLKDLYNNYKTWRKIIYSGSHPYCSVCIYPDIVTRGTLRSKIASFLRKTLTRYIWR